MTGLSTDMANDNSLYQNIPPANATPYFPDGTDSWVVSHWVPAVPVPGSLSTYRAKASSQTSFSPRETTTPPSSCRRVLYRGSFNNRRLDWHVDSLVSWKAGPLALGNLLGDGREEEMEPTIAAGLLGVTGEH